MFETPSSYSFLSTTSVSAGQTITFTDASGNVLATFTLPNGSAEMVMCSQESSVTCYTGGTLSGTTYFASQDSTNRCGYGGTISGGELLQMRQVPVLFLPFHRNSLTSEKLPRGMYPLK